MKFISNKITNLIQRLRLFLCKLITCDKFTIFNNNSSLPLNSFQVYRHINNFNEDDFPMKYIFNFYDLTNKQLSSTIKDHTDLDTVDEDYDEDDEDYDENDEYVGILLTLKVKSCSNKTIAGNYLEFPFYDSLNSYNNQLVLNNIPVNLYDEKKNVDLTFYISKLILDYCEDIDTYEYGDAVDIIFDYKFITNDEYYEHIKNLYKLVKN